MDPWERQPCDNEASYAAFLRYRDQGPGRKLSLAGVTPQQLLDWHNAHGWRERVAAYDRMMDQAAIEARKAKAAQAAETQDEDHRAILGDARALVRLEMEKRIKDCLANPDTPTMSIAEMHKLLDTVVKLERTQVGKPTEITRLDLSGLTDEELEEAERLARKAKGLG